MKQKPNVETAAMEIPSGGVVVSAADDSVFNSLAVCLAEIRKLEGVLGYILRSDTSAVIDLAEQEKIIEYAILSSQISESSVAIAKQFHLANLDSVLVLGKRVKVICMVIGENKIGVFMEKTTVHGLIIKRILS